MENLYNLVAILPKIALLNQSEPFRRLLAMISSPDEEFMSMALEQARAAATRGEVPVGAVLTLEGKVIAQGRNRVEEGRDATLHAEMVCLREGARLLGNWRLNNTILYCTLEPCPMCAGAILLSRVKKVVWGAPDLRHGACGTLFKILGFPHPIHEVETEGGVLHKECAAILQQFFVERRGDDRTVR